MTVDIARLDANAVAVTAGASDALHRLGEWVEAARNAHQLVAPLVDTPFVPDAYRPKVDPRATPEQRHDARQQAVANATAAVLQGVTLGLDPLTALQQIYIVHGRPGMYAKAMVALVQSRGHEVWTEDESDTRVVVAGRRKGTEHVERVTVTMDQARKAGWTSNQAYTKTPRDMLWSRAAARVCDRIASDAVKGISSVEEIQDSIKATAEVNGTRTVAPRRRATPPALEAAEDPPLDEATPVPVEPTEAPEPTEVVVDEQAPSEPGITPAQSRKLYALLRQTGRQDRDLALVFISGVVGREIGSTKELTLREAIGVIDVLETEGLGGTAEPEPEP